MAEVTWENTIKLMFTEKDISQMKALGYDLGSYKDVVAQKDSIYAGVKGGSLPPPPEGPWNQEQVETFKTWIDNGTPRGLPPPPITSGWSVTTAPPAGSRYDDVLFVSDIEGWAVNSDGLVLHTTDGGINWTLQFQTPLIGSRPVYPRALAFTTKLRGWLGTLTRGYELFETTDGGESWTLVEDLPPEKPTSICGMFAVNEKVVYASGTNFPTRPVGVLKTTDGGAKWTATDMTPYATALIDIFFFDEDHGFVVGGKPKEGLSLRDNLIPVVLYTSDGGNTWENKVEDLEFDKGEWGWKIYFVNAQVGYVSLEALERAAVLKTTDGGMTWVRLPINDQQGNANLEGVGFITEKRGFVGGWGDADGNFGYTSATVDGGENWVDANEVGLFINRFRFLGDPVRVGYAAGRYIYKYNPLAPPTLESRKRELEIRKIGAMERFVNAATIQVEVPTGTKHAWLHLRDRFGEDMKVLLDEEGPAAGKRGIVWDGLDDKGSPVPPGIYLYRLTADDVVRGGCFYLGRA